jgi:hypothetical protein
MKNMQQKIQLTGNPANFSGCKSEMNRSDGLLQRLELQTSRRFERSAAVERFERFEPRLGSHLREICSKILFLLSMVLA